MLILLLCPNSQLCSPLWNSETLRTSRLFYNVYLENQLEPLSFLKGLHLGGVTESPPGKVPLSDLVPILKWPLRLRPQFQKQIPGWSRARDGGGIQWVCASVFHQSMDVHCPGEATPSSQKMPSGAGTKTSSFRTMFLIHKHTFINSHFYLLFVWLPNEQKIWFEPEDFS